MFERYGLLDRNASHFESGKKKKSSKPPPFKGVESKTKGGATAVAAPTGVGDKTRGSASPH